MNKTKKRYSPNPNPKTPIELNTETGDRPIDKMMRALLIVPFVLILIVLAIQLFS